MNYPRIIRYNYPPFLVDFYQNLAILAILLPKLKAQVPVGAYQTIRKTGRVLRTVVVAGGSHNICVLLLGGK